MAGGASKRVTILDSIASEPLVMAVQVTLMAAVTELSSSEKVVRRCSAIRRELLSLPSNELNVAASLGELL